MIPHPVHDLAIEFIAAAITSHEMRMTMAMVDMTKDNIDSVNDKLEEDYMSRFEPQVELNTDPRPNSKPLVIYDIYS